MTPLLALLFAILSPLLWAVMNVYDKFVLTKRVDNPFGYAVVVGFIHLVLGLVLCTMLHWYTYSFSVVWPALLAGVLMGLNTFCYVWLFKHEDVSHIIGLLYLYPVLVALLSFLFLSERLALYGYIGVLLILAGSLLLNVRFAAVRKVSLWLLLTNIVIVACMEFFAKVATNSVSGWQGFSLNTFAFGATLVLGLCVPSIRVAFRQEWRNIRFALFGETLTAGALVCLYLAMSALPATVVSSFQALQALAVILFERVAEKYVGGMTKDKSLLHKAGAIALIVIGVVLVTMAA